MKKITKPNGEIIICSEYDSELDEESLSVNSEYNTDFGKEIEVLDEHNDFSDFGISEEVKVTVSFGSYEDSKDFITIEEIHGVIKSYSKKSFTHKIELFVDIDKSCEVIKKINIFSLLTDIFDFKISISYMGITSDLYGTGKILFYKFSKIKNGKVLYKIVLE
jgi:hypothetical protein